MQRGIRAGRWSVGGGLFQRRRRCFVCRQSLFGSEGGGVASTLEAMASKARGRRGSDTAQRAR